MTVLDPDRIGALVTEALERTAFVLADTIQADQAAGFSPTHFSTITYSGVADGLVLLAADESFVTEVASSLLGVEPEDVDPQVEGRDVLNELVNIIGGSLILELGGADQHYDYGLPMSVTERDLPAVPSGAVECYVESESGVLRVSWYPNLTVTKAA